MFTNGATTDDGNTASSSLLSLSCSTGKAFVGGFEIEKILLVNHGSQHNDTICTLEVKATSELALPGF